MEWILDIVFGAVAVSAGLYLFALIWIAIWVLIKTRSNAND